MRNNVLLSIIVFILIYFSPNRGSSQTATLLKDIYPGKTSSYPHDMIKSDNNEFLLFGETSLNPPKPFYIGFDLVKSDGTPEGTKTIKTFESREYLTGDLTRLNSSQFIFTGADSSHGMELWTLDKNNDSTYLIKDFNPGINGSSPDIGPVVNGKAFFQVLYGSYPDSLSWQLWITDGTIQGTHKLIDSINIGYDHPIPLSYGAVLNNIFVFYALDPVKNLVGNLWRSDGTDKGTYKIKTFQNFYSLNKIINYNNILLLDGFDDEHGVELWQTDGTDSGTKIIKDIQSGNESSVPNEFTPLNDKVYFTTNGPLGTGLQLWLTDGTSNGTKEVDSNLEISSIMGISGSYLYFNANSVNSKNLGVWATNGIDGEVVHLTNDSVSISTYGTDETEFINIDNTAYFVGGISNENGYSTNWSLYKSDASFNRTIDIFDNDLNSQRATIFNLTNVNGKIFFVSNNGGEQKGGQSLYSYDSITRVKKYDFISAKNDKASILLANGSDIFLSLNGTSTGNEPYIYSTALILNINPPYLSSINQPIKIFPNPSSGTFTLNFYDSKSEGVFFLQMDLTGRIVFQQKMMNKNTFVQLPKEISNGVYMVRIFSRNTSYQKLIEVQR